MFIDSFHIKEEDSRSSRLRQEVCCQSGNPLEDAKPGTRLENEKGDSLLKEEANNDGGPI